MEVKKILSQRNQANSSATVQSEKIIFTPQVLWRIVIISPNAGLPFEVFTRLVDGTGSEGYLTISLHKHEFQAFVPV